MNFSIVVGDTLCFTKAPASSLNNNNLVRLFECEGDMNIKFRGRRIIPYMLNLPYSDSIALVILGGNYSV